MFLRLRLKTRIHQIGQVDPADPRPVWFWVPVDVLFFLLVKWRNIFCDPPGPAIPAGRISGAGPPEKSPEISPDINSKKKVVLVGFSS